MATNPKKTIDPTEAALSAIQAALNIRLEEQQAKAEPEQPSEPVSILGETLQAPTPTSPVPPPVPPAPPEPDVVLDSEAIGTRDLAAPSATPANDDQQSICQVLQALQRRPARTPYFIAALFSAAWVIGCLALSWAFLPELSTILAPGHSPAALMIGLGAASLLPIIFFFGVAHLAWRNQELRLIAQSMAGVAMRLSEPETAARDSIVSVGQAIRREVAAMGDGVERALARASELEALVQNEVAALGRTYGDNEVRIRGLIQDLANQRDSLVSQAEQVRTAINNVHIDLTQDLSTISDLVGQQVKDAAQRITQSLSEKGEQITVSLGQVGDDMIQQLSVRGGGLLDRLQNTSAETSSAISAASDRLTSSLNFKANHVGEEFAEIAQGLEDMLTSRLDRVTEGFSEKSLAVVDMMVGRSQELTDQMVGRSQELSELVNGRAQGLTDSIIETSSRIAEKIATSAEELNSTLRASGESLIVDLNLRGGEVAARLEQTGTRITDSLVARSSGMTDSVRESTERLVEVVGARSDAMQEMLATRLAAYEDLFNNSGAALGEKISRDAAALGDLITRNLSEFDRTVKTHGAELIERLGGRTQEVSDSMRSYIDSFDGRVSSRTNEVTASLDQHLTNFQETLDTRTQALNEGLSTRVMDIAKTLAEGGKEVISAVDKRVGEITAHIDSQAQKLADTVGERVANVDKALGAGALQVANTLDTRIEHLEQLLVGRAEAVIREMDVQSRAAADLLNTRLVELSDSIETSSTNAERTLSELLSNTTEALGKSVAATSAVTEALNRSANEATASLNRSAGALSTTIGNSAAAASETLGKSAATATEAITSTAETASEMLGRSAVSVREAIDRSAASATEAIGQTASAATELMDKTARTSAEAIGRSASEAERTLVGMSADVARNIVGRADDIHAAVSQRVSEMTHTLDEKSHELLTSLSAKGEQFAGEVTRVTDQAVKAIEAKGLVFAQSMMDNSEEIARLINDASQTATSAVTRTLGQFQEGTQGVADAAKSSIARTLEDLHGATRAVIEESKKTAAATVADMMETHSMLRSDSTALFERLREANILLQEVLSGAHENMNAIEHTMVSRVSEFVTAMNDLDKRTGTATAKVEEHLGTFNTTTVKVLRDLGDLSAQFSTHGHSLAEAVTLLEQSNRRTDQSVSTRHANIESLVATLDAHTDDFEQRLRRFSGLLDESLESATARAREISGIVAATSNDSVHTIEQQLEAVRTAADEQRKRTSEAISSACEESAGQVDAMFNQSAQRFTEVIQGMKQMAAEMQQELETTRTELRRGLFELPQEAAESTAQMRRVIVDQIEALAELNRIVARHGRALDAVEPTRREFEPAFATVGRAQQRPARPEPGPGRPVRDITGAPARRPDAPPLSPIQGGRDGNGRGGWLSDLLTRASREDPPAAPAPNPRAEERAPRDAIGSLETLSVDIARMIDHEATAALWERYQRGERGLGNLRLYNAQGQKAFEEIRNKYRNDPEFRQTVEHYIHEFERLLGEVSRGDRGPAVARNYLTSDTGKVYTMLAHAAGRFDQ
jgi:DNA anti-recombination protein RmuC